MDELRIEVWDLLFRADQSKTITEIAESVGRDDDTIRDAVEHEWFTVDDSYVTISRPAGS